MNIKCMEYNVTLIEKIKPILGHIHLVTESLAAAG
jgi:hypothetical protein